MAYRISSRTKKIILLYIIRNIGIHKKVYIISTKRRSMSNKHYNYSDDIETIAILEGDEAKAFQQYAQKESTEEEKKN